MESVDAGTISKGGKSVHVTFRRTVHGPVYGYAKARGTNKQVALSTAALELRARDGRPALLPADDVRRACTRPTTSSAPRTRRRRPSTRSTRARTSRRSITSGLLPLRPKGVNPDLPVNGEGKYEWKGYLANSAAPAGHQPVDRLHRQLEQQAGQGLPGLRQPLERAVAAASEAAHRRAGAPARSRRWPPSWPRPTRPPPRTCASSSCGRRSRRCSTAARRRTRRDKQIVALLQAWHDAGGSRRDADRDGKIDDPGVPILDAAWKGLSRRRAVRPPRHRAVQAARGAQRALRPAARRPVRRLAPVHVEGPARDARPEGGRRLPPALLRRRQREDLLEGAVGGARRGAQAPGRPAGRRPGRVARARGQGADHLRPAAADHHAVHEQADRHPPGDAVRRRSRAASARRPWRPARAGRSGRGSRRRASRAGATRGPSRSPRSCAARRRCRRWAGRGRPRARPRARAG